MGDDDAVLQSLPGTAGSRIVGSWILSAEGAENKDAAASALHEALPKLFF